MFESAVWFEVLLILGLILLNGLFAMSEIALVSARKSRLRQRAAADDRGAGRALRLAGEPTRFLSTVQVGITTIGVLAGAYGGASLAAHLDVWLEQFPALASYSEGLALAAVVAGITFTSLVLGELVPKRIALEHPEEIASLVAGPMHRIATIASPLVHLLTWTTDGVLRALRMPNSTEPAITEEDVTAMIEEGTATGVFETEEAGLVERVFRLDDLTVGMVMTPRHLVAWLDIDDPLEAQLAALSDYGHTRYLIADGDLDNVLGMVRAIDLVPWLAAGNGFDLRALMMEPLFVPETMPTLQLLTEFRASRVHLAVVVGGSGTVEGIVTLNDVLDEIAGEIDAAVAEPMVRRDDGSWLVDADMAWDEAADALDIVVDGTRPRPYDTVGGFVLERLGRVPRTGENFDAYGCRFEVVDMDGPRIDKLLVKPADAGAGRPDASA